MRKVGLREKEEFLRQMKVEIYATQGIEASAKQNIENYLKTNLLNGPKTDEDLKRLKEEIQTMIKNSTKKVVDKVSENLAEPTKSNISEINDISTLKKSNGTVITSVKTNDGSIYVKDSSYSGDIKQVVEEIVRNNPNITQKEIESLAFREIQRRQIDINTTNVNNSTYDNKTKEKISQQQGDNKQVNREYGIAIDENNRITDLGNMEYGTSYESENEVTQQKTNVEKPKVKVYSRFNDAAFVDAMLLGTITLYTGVLGLCSIFIKM